MKIVVNTRLLIKNRLEGIGWFTYQTLKRITSQHPEHDFIFLFDRKYSEEFIFSENITPMVLFPQARHPLLYYAYFEYVVPRLLKKLNADIFLSPDGFASTASKIKTLLVIHDLNFMHSPGNIPFLTRKYYHYFIPRYARMAERIVTVSDFSKKDISNILDISPDKIDVVYNGADEGFAPLNEKDITETRNKYAKGGKYFIFIGALHPRKNLLRILKAFDMLKQDTGLPVKLLIVGKKMFKAQKIFVMHKSLKSKDDIIFLGNLSARDLSFVLGSAIALVYASTYEGFGIPIIEAMQSGVPVITSNVTSMPETAGNSVLLVDPYSVDSIKNGMLQLAVNDNLRTRLIEKGMKQSKKFSWDKTASKLWESIEKCF